MSDQNVEYATISSLVYQLKTYKSSALTNFDVVNHTFNTLVHDVNGYYAMCATKEDFNVIYFPPNGKSTIKEVLNILEPLVEKHGDAIIKTYPGYNACIVGNTKHIVDDHIHFVFLPFTDEILSKTHLVESAKMEEEKFNLLDKVYKLNKVTGNDKDLLEAFLIKMLGTGSSKLTIYLIGTNLHFDFKHVIKRFPNIEEGILKSVFIGKGNNLFVCSKTLEELEEMNKIVKMYCVANVKYTFDTLLEKFKIPELYIVKFFEESKENSNIFLCKNEKLFLEVSELY